MTNVSEELARLAALRDSGVLSEEEFQAQKTQVLQGRSATTPPPTPSPMKSKRKPLLGCLGLIALLIILGIVFAPSKPTADTAQPATGAAAVAPIETTSLAISRAYEENEAGAQQQFGNKPLLVSGTVKGVMLDFSDNPVVQLNGTNQFLHVQANLIEADHSKAAGLSKGSKITLECQNVTEVASMPILKDCAIK